jgi:hypothetical protein
VKHTTLTANIKGYPNRAFVKAPDEGGFRLFVWNSGKGNWDEAGEFPTLRAAKAVGRLLAAIELPNI